MSNLQFMWTKMYVDWNVPVMRGHLPCRDTFWVSPHYRFYCSSHNILSGCSVDIYREIALPVSIQFGDSYIVLGVFADIFNIVHWFDILWMHFEWLVHIQAANKMFTQLYKSYQLSGDNFKEVKPVFKGHYLFHVKEPRDEWTIGILSCPLLTGVTVLGL